MPPKKRGRQQHNKEIKQSDNGRFSPDEKDTLVLSTEEHKNKDADFLAICKKLDVTDVVCDHAWRLWEMLVTSADVLLDTKKKHWGVCLFIAATDLGVRTFTLTEVQKAVDLNQKQFFDLLKNMDVNVDTISTKVNAVMTRLEKKYDVLQALFQRFEKTCCKVYADTSSQRKEGQDSKQIMRNCWTLFLLVIGKVLQVEEDLVISFQLLMCVLDFYIKRCPATMLQQPYKTVVSALSGSPPTRTSRRNQGRAKPRPLKEDHKLLEILCKENDCSMEEVKHVYLTSFSAFLDSMKLSGSRDLPEEDILDKQYEELYLKSKDFDARLFLDNDETLQMNKTDLEKPESIPKKSSPEEEHVLIQHQTPVRVAMLSIHQLKVILSSASGQPSDTLNTFFKNCTVDPSEEITNRVEHLGKAFSQRFAECVGQQCVEIGCQRFSLGVRLYYRVMESILKSEEKRLSVQNFSILLNNSTFHISLLACALEVVMATYGGMLKNGALNGGGGGSMQETDLSFPWILDVFQLSAFDFYKVVESFIKAEPSLSRDIIKHLERCEHLIMESIAWRGDSPLFELLSQSQDEEDPVGQAEPPSTLNQPLQHNHTAADLYLSPLRPSSRIGPLDFHSSPLSQTSVQSFRCTKSISLSLFYRKVYRLAYLRLNMLCTLLLKDHPDLEPIIWTLLQHTLRHEYELMKDRHLDQLMMSAMYAICKVKNIDLRFKTIVTAYKSLPNTNQETFKRVLIREGQYDSIIVFYNLVFMQKLKTKILQYTSPLPPTLSPIPQIPCSPYKYPSSPLQVPGSNNVYISPLKNSRLSPGVMTPRSRILVSIGESFGTSDKFQKINEMVSSSDWSLKRSFDQGSTPKPLKRLRFDMDGQDEADGSKSTGKSKLIQKLAEMSSTRTLMQEQKLKDSAHSAKGEQP
ncbi:retinoblastoma-associated protein [Scleropages formosus]|uniref:retinoblastoma-associated protein n=1 Tax=Scleropages formosus TaxID=113540 RepID=UPI0008780884|nr:retinoblastoma-associated protein [Scleropages formosus]